MLVGVQKASSFSSAIFRRPALFSSRCQISCTSSEKANLVSPFSHQVSFLGILVFGSARYDTVWNQATQSFSSWVDCPGHNTMLVRRDRQGPYPQVGKRLEYRALRQGEQNHGLLTRREGRSGSPQFPSVPSAELVLST